MGIPAGLTRLTLSGALSTGEIWASSWWETGRTPADCDDVAAAAIVGAASFTILSASARALMSTTDTLGALDLYHYTGGSGATTHGHATIGSAGTGANNHPKQIAAVMTLRTALATRSGRGRMYFPATGVTVAGTGLMNAAAVDSLVDALRSVFTVHVAGGFPPVVLSQTTSSSQPIKTIDADYVPDTQRRRRNRLTSTRHSATV